MLQLLKHLMKKTFKLQHGKLSCENLGVEIDSYLFADKLVVLDPKYPKLIRMLGALWGSEYAYEDGILGCWCRGIQQPDDLVLEGYPGAEMGPGPAK